MFLGEMRHPARIERDTFQKDSEGFEGVTPSVLARPRVYHEERTATTRWTNRAAFSAATDRFICRRIPGVEVKSGDRIVADNHRYLVESANVVQGMYLDIYATRVEGVSTDG